MATSAARLVGRLEQIAVLDEALDELGRGRSVAVEISGEPGIGKTRLLTEVARRAEDRGQLVLSGSASELEQDLPFWIFVNALDDYLQGLDPQRLASLDEEVRNRLADVFPGLAVVSGSSGSAPEHERHRTHRAVRDLLERLTATRPLVLVLDDVHWADPASVELLGALLREPPDAPVLIAFAGRPRHAQGRLSMALERAYRAEALVRISLDVLTPAEAQDLLGETIGPAAGSVLYADSGGNPFYLEQLARSAGRAVDATVVATELTASLDVPRAVAAALAEELSLLSGSGRRVAQAAAVVGDPFDPELVGGAAAIPEPTVLAAIDELLGLDVVCETEVPRRFRFRHPLVRRAIYESMPAGQRLSAHERTARALADRGAPASSRAHHVERSGRQGDAHAVAQLREAGDGAAHRAPASAARWFAAALRLLRDDAPPAERVELLLARATALASCGYFAEGYVAIRESIELLPQEAIALRTRLTAACAGVEHLLGHHERAHNRLQVALDGLEDPSSPEAVALMIELAVDGVYRMEFHQIGPWAQRAVEGARPLGDPALTATANAVRAWGAALIGATAEAEVYRSEAAALVDGLSDLELASRLEAAVHLAGAELYLDRFDEAGSHAERVITVARATGQPAFVLFAFAILAWVRMLHGELAEGADMLDAAVEESRLLGNSQSLAGLLLNRSLMALAAGDLKLAAPTAEESIDLTRDLDDGLVPAAAALALAAALLETHAPGLGDAVDLMCGRCGGVQLPLMPGGSFRAKWLELLTRCWLALDRPGDAAQAAASARTTAEAMGQLQMATAMADRAAAAVALASGDPEVAYQKALASAAAADGVGIPVEAALSRTLAGRALAEAGQPQRAIEELERAATALDACGAVGDRDAAEQELRRLGRRVHRRTRPGALDGTGLEALTQRERQVADLVVDRRTNPEIAEHLFLSLKTVETHLRHIFGKLEVTSRVEVARRIEADRQDGAKTH
jgi:DNA-binding CsgD family transcriptional regulator